MQRIVCVTKNRQSNNDANILYAKAKNVGTKRRKNIMPLMSLS